MAKIYGSLPLDFIKETTILPQGGVPVDLREIQKERLGNRLASLKEYVYYQQPDMTKIAALAKNVASETKLPYKVLLLWNSTLRKFDTPRLLGLAKNHENRELLVPTRLVQCWPLLIREEEHTDSNDKYYGTLYYQYCLTSAGDLIVVSRDSKFAWEYSPILRHSTYRGGSHIEPIKDDNIRLFDYQALWQTEKRTSSNWKEGNLHPYYDANSGNPHPDRKCLVEYPGEGIAIMLGRLLQGGSTTFRIEKNEATHPQIEAYRENLKKQDIAEGYAFTNDEIALLVRYETAKQSLDKRENNVNSFIAERSDISDDELLTIKEDLDKRWLTPESPVVEYKQEAIVDTSNAEVLFSDGSVTSDEALRARQDRVIKLFKEKFIAKYPGRPLPSETEISTMFFDKIVMRERNHQ
jgi:hypothetical protein